MLVMAGKGHTVVHYWAGLMPNCIGHIYSPGKSFQVYSWLEYAVDNGKFAAHAANREWHPTQFIEFCQYVRGQAKQPLWVVVPDAIYDAQGTLTLWQEWQPRLREFGFRLAFAAQNGLTPAQVPADADVIFMGGTDDWKYANLKAFVSLGKPVHVGRVNGDRLWQCYNAGVASCDGSGWFRGDRQQLAKLERFIQFQANKEGVKTAGQLDLTAMYFEPQPRIPPNINREHCIQAIKGWWGTPAQHKPQRYAVRYEGQHYPIKLLIARANLFANGVCLDPRTFSGGRDANRFIRARGFEVVQIEV